MTKILHLKDLPITESTVCTVGNFDGLHLGHKEIIKKVKDIAKKENLKSLVITFHPHPRKILNPKKYKCSIVNLETKIYLFKKENIDYLLIVEFNKDFYQKSAFEFLNFLKNALKCKVLIVGKDWKFGFKQEGDIQYAKKVGSSIGIKVIPIEDIKSNSSRISSSLIRELLSKGELKKVEKLLGRRYFLIEKVVKGDGKGREIGFPTINLKPDDDLCLKKGVYVGYLEKDEKVYKAVINYGNRPTLDGKKTFIEVHLIEDKVDLKTEEDYVKVYFIEYLREEKKFESVEDLKNQIKLDIQKAKEVLEVEKVV
ncbi:riboflavin biosynthesis protein RibF [Sulfurihydrogenibium azorense Az-Fu1]|jgi:riboflavin kinase/FMN adenylyltransferase|uniref:Riboflavin biosynthesis protein n=1 Tax=Sulfurihydrogenibium azorense (strain DSM 15241 / OCM 825 / Az-Fu1) TaxID=204536 RepID=C1DXQ2_SULAA|nr:bifunctional riboflavin kinase/FAD synthetase [Sulfurihydrogenibium azorense]ACN98668.1 riboflavin biosynthesis protein RibF [Sulfurihydrogenibium azorense Az-Fu1]